MSNYGSEFYIGALPNLLGNSLIQLYITTPSSYLVNFTVETKTGVMINSTVTSMTPAVIDLTSYDIIPTDSSYANRNKGIRVYTQIDGELISVLLVNYLEYTKGEYLAYPYKDFQIKQYKYFAVSTETLVGFALSQALLVGNEDNTSVTIVATQSLNFPQDTQSTQSDTIFVPAGTAYTFTLHKLQTIIIGSQFDITGTSIVSNKPLTVVSGHECGNIPLVCCCEHLAVQVPPTVTWGKQYLLTPYANLTVGPYYKVIASESQTTVTLTCDSYSNTTYLFHSGDFTVINSNGSYCSINSDKPVLVNQLGPSGGVSSHESDPVISTIPPVGQYSSTVTFVVLNIQYHLINYINIAISTKDTILLNGQPLLVEWNEILDLNDRVIGYGTQIATTDEFGIHIYNVTTQSNTKFSLLVYGFHSSTGYSYSAGINLNQLVKGKLSMHHLISLNCCYRFTANFSMVWQYYGWCPSNSLWPII